MQAALQAQGYAEWGLTLESAYTSIPMPGNFTFPCSLKYGVFCLGEPSLCTKDDALSQLLTPFKQQRLVIQKGSEIVQDCLN